MLILPRPAQVGLLVAPRLQARPAFSLVLQLNADVLTRPAMKAVAVSSTISPPINADMLTI
jgi:hypothetical protein